MKDNKYLAWTSFVLFALSTATTLLFVIFSVVLRDTIENPGIFVLLVGVFSLLATIMGFLSFRAPQAKVGAIGGLVLLLLVLFIIPIGREVSVTSPQPATNVQEKTRYSGIPQIDTIIETALADNLQAELQLLQFSTLACTHAEGFGGPPKCRAGEEEGTKIEAFPFLGSEGHHMRRDEAGNWTGIRATSVYAVYRVSDQVYSDEFFPAGEYAIVFLFDNEQDATTAQVRGGKIVRLDTIFGGPSAIDLEQVASEIILAPPK